MEASNPEGLSVAETAKALAGALGADFSEDSGQYKYAIDISDDISIDLKIEKSRLDRIYGNIYEDKKQDGLVLYSNKYYEVSVQNQSTFPSLPTGKEIKKRDTTNKLSYRVGSPSDEFIIYLVNAARSRESLSSLKYYIRAVPRRLKRYQGEDGGFDFEDPLDFIREISFGLDTLKISSEKERSRNKLSDLANSFMFQLSYNLNSALVTKKDINEIIQVGRVSRSRRSNPEDIESPKRYYNEDLIYHYQMGVSSEKPSLQFLSFYHIPEHFFDSVFEEDLVEDLKGVITQPDFSYRRKSDIRSVISRVSKRLRVRNEEITYSEKEALKLTLKKYIDPAKLLKEIREYDQGLVEFYKTNKVDFSDGPKVNLENDDKNLMLNNVASRLYDTRNSIVHSKGQRSDKYIPFKHDRNLLKEIPLIKSISENLIIEKSDIIKQ